MNVATGTEAVVLGGAAAVVAAAEVDAGAADEELAAAEVEAAAGAVRVTPAASQNLTPKAVAAVGGGEVRGWVGLDLGNPMGGGDWYGVVSLTTGLAGICEWIEHTLSIGGVARGRDTGLIAGDELLGFADAGIVGGVGATGAADGIEGAVVLLRLCEYVSWWGSLVPES